MGVALQCMGLKSSLAYIDAIISEHFMLTEFICVSTGQAELVPLEGLLPHLAPPDAEALESLQSARKKLAEEVAKIGIVSLTQAAAEKVRTAAAQLPEVPA
jgi:hypothetical protein